MKQLAQYQDGRLELQEVPPPMPPPGGILVRVTHSVISPGTEKMKVEQARMSLLQKAKARPDQVRKVLDTARTLGWKSAIAKVKNRLESPTPLGYSGAGVVEVVDPANTRFRVGDRVACGGAECAFHAEYIAVPDLLASPVPEGVEAWQAAYTTLVSISMHAVRQSGVTLGERVLVLGAGLVGQLSVALLHAAGVRAMAVDFQDGRLAVAARMGAEQIVNSTKSDLQDAIDNWTEGLGVDAVLLCVGGKSPEPMQQAVEALRDRGTLVIVGIYDAPLDWKSSFAKEIQIRYSRSYGPGRYDRHYEEQGHDYPLGYVRWTENRNFEAALHLMASGKLDLSPVTTRRAKFEDALGVYDELMRDGNADIGVVLEYAANEEERHSAELAPHSPVSAEDEALFPSIEKLGAAVQTVDVIGAGNFARTMLLPHLKDQMKLGIVVNGTGLSARHVKEKFGFEGADTDPAKVFGQDGVAPHGVLIATRHHLHASYVTAALASGRHVFVEKPLCLTREELTSIDASVLDSSGSVMVGFNRRFAPAAVYLKECLHGIAGPKSLAFHICAGKLTPDHWYADAAQSGGRILGEACHFLDFACSLLGKPTRIQAQRIGASSSKGAPDAMAAQIEFADGSSAQILYTSEGDTSFPKETFRLFASGFTAECENFQKLTLHQNRKATKKTYASKGHAEEMAAWVSFLKAKTSHPLPYAEARQSMALTFSALDSMREGKAITL